MEFWDKKSKEEILKAFNDYLSPKCPKCNRKLSVYWYYSDYYEFQKCENCGEIIKRPTYEQRKNKRKIHNC